MMTHTHLHELLKEDQEPFQLKNYIADRRSQLKLTETTKRRAIIEPPTCTLKFCINNACLFTFQDSPPTKSPCKSSKSAGFGSLVSFLKRLKHKSTLTKRHEITSLNNTKSSLPRKKFRGKDVANEVEVSLDANGSAYCTPRSADWSETETSCSSISVHESCFHFSLQKSPSVGHRKPDFLSPATSPNRCLRRDKEYYDIELSKEINVEDEEQCSPLSVLDPPFEDDEHEYDVVKGDTYDLESSYATLQRTKHQLLQKLLRFERLVELDPIALEEHMAEECDDDEDDDYECVLGDVAKEEPMASEEFLRGIINHLGIKKIPLHVERLVLDLISEENKNEEHEVVVKRVCQRFDSWKLVESNTIDMMVEFELRKEKSEGWKRHDREMAKEIVINIEVTIMGVLVEEFAQEVVDSCPCPSL